jgi:MORN repeat variant
MQHEKTLMRILTLVVLVAMSSCTETQKVKEDDATTEVTPVASAVADTAADFQDLPAGAVKEEFGDTPDVVRVHVKNGMNYSQLGTYKDKKRDGNWIEYHPNGLVKSITPYVDGKKEGLMVEIGTNGTLEKRVLFHNNLRHGEYKEFNYATVKEERFYQFDKLEGIVKIYYPDGKIMEEGAYKNGTRDGLSKWYNQEGKVTIEYEYKNGELIKK